MRGRILRSLGADTLGQLLNIGIRLMLIPLFLSTWGAAAYGEWLILTALAAWFALGDLGGQLYFINRLTAEWAGGKIDQFQRVLSTALLLFIVISGVMLCIVLLALSWLPLVSWLGVKVVDHDIAKAVLLLMALRFLVSLPFGILLGIYRAIGTQATSVMFGNLVLLLQFVASAVALLAGAGMLFLAALEVLPLVLVLAVVMLDLRRRLPKEVGLFVLSKADKSIFLSAISPSLHFLGLQVSAAMMVQGSILVLAKTLGPIEVATFSSMRTASNVMARFMGMLAHSAWPEITRLASLGQGLDLEKLFRLVLHLALLVGICFLVVIAHSGENLYIWWLNGSLPYDYWAMYLLSCQVVITILWTWGGNLLMATNSHAQYARWQFPVNLLALFLCYYGSVKFGLFGAVAGLFAGQSLPMLCIVAWLLIKKGWHQMARTLVGTALVGLIILPSGLNIWTGLLSIASVLAWTSWANRQMFIGAEQPRDSSK